MVWDGEIESNGVMQDAREEERQARMKNETVAVRIRYDAEDEDPPHAWQWKEVVREEDAVVVHSYVGEDVVWCITLEGDDVQFVNDGMCPKCGKPAKGGEHLTFDQEAFRDMFQTMESSLSCIDSNLSAKFTFDMTGDEIALMWSLLAKAKAGLWSIDERFYDE